MSERPEASIPCRRLVFAVNGCGARGIPPGRRFGRTPWSDDDPLPLLHSECSIPIGPRKAPATHELGNRSVEEGPMFGFDNILWFIVISILVIIPNWQIFKKAGFDPRLSLLVVVPIVNICLIYYVAFSRWRPRAAQYPRARAHLQAEGRFPLTPQPFAASMPPLRSFCQSNQLRRYTEVRAMRRSHLATGLILPALLVAAALLAPLHTQAQLPPGPANHWQIDITPVRADAAILLEPSTGQILYEQEADLPHTPASIVKLMLELLVVERLADGTLSLDDSIRTSRAASQMGGSQVYLAEGEVFALDDLMRAITIASANDACVAVAEHVAGTEEGFVDLMNQRARQLGLTNTHYVDCTGLEDDPDDGNISTARDIAATAQRLIDYPHILAWSAIEVAPFRDGKFTLYNTNKLLGRFSGLDGLKTGYTEHAGYCLCATAERGGLRMVSVVLGAESEEARFEETARLLGSGFAQLRRETLARRGEALPGEVTISGGHPKRVGAVLGEDLTAVLPRGVEAPALHLVPYGELRAPVAKGDTIGLAEVRIGGTGPVQVPALAAASVAKANIFQQLIGLFQK
ncbi:MAG: hypothetical protein GF330_12780 [Candidatus Eisenbacteria bacterium]|nr:hypothetical protein [Candidatus Eisenbacteria bacterium]